MQSTVPEKETKEVKAVPSASLSVSSDSPSILISPEVLAIIERVRANDPTLTTLCLNYDAIGAHETKALANALSSNTTLTKLSLHSNRIGSDGAKALANALSNNTTLTELNLWENNIGDDGTEALANALSSNTTLTNLILRDNRIGNTGAEALADALKSNTTLTNLDLEKNTIDNDGAKALADALSSNTTLTNLILRNNGIGNTGVEALADALKNNASVTSLNLSHNCISAGGAEALANALKNNTILTNLILEGNIMIGWDGAKAFANALKSNTTLTNLDLEKNTIDNDGAKALADALSSNTTLTNLNLERNPMIDCDGAKAFANVLSSSNTTLLRLGLDCYPDYVDEVDEVNDIDTSLTRNLRLKEEKEAKTSAALPATRPIVPAREVKEVKAASSSSSPTSSSSSWDLTNPEVLTTMERVRTNDPTLTELNLNLKAIGDNAIKALANALRSNTTLTSLHLQANSFGDEGIKALADALKNNSALTSLDLSCNTISEEGAKALADALENNTTLTSLNLWCTNFRGEGLKALANALKNNTTLTSLNLYRYANADIKVFTAIETFLTSNLRLKKEKEAKTSAALPATRPMPPAKMPVTVIGANEGGRIISPEEKSTGNSTPLAIPTSAAVTPANAEEVRAIKAQLGSVDRRLLEIEAKTEDLSPVVIEKLNASNSIVDGILEKALAEKAVDAEHERVMAEEHLTVYYGMFLVLLEGACRACESIYSGFATAAKRGKADRTSQTLDEAAKFVPGLGIPLKLIAGVIKAGNLPSKQGGIHNLAFFFAQEKNPDEMMRALARRLAIGQAENLKNLAGESPIGYKEKAKQGFRQLRNWFLADQGHNLVMAKARADCEKIIEAIIKGRLKPPVNPDQIMRRIIGAGHVAPAAPAKKITTTTTVVALRLTASSSSSSLAAATNSASVPALIKASTPGETKRLSSPTALPAATASDAHVSVREGKEPTTGISPIAELEAKHAARIAALEAQHQTTQAALIKSNEELAKIKKELGVADTPIAGNGGTIQAQASRPGAKHPRGYDPSFQAADEMRRQELREQATQRERLEQQEARLAMLEEKLRNASRQNDKCIIL
jgi:Ran GTPase-activating protein (RanGAP) involved in mRNA processing and transport